MEKFMVICGCGALSTATIGLLGLALAFLSGWEWAYRGTLACGALLLLFLFWCGLLSECV